MSGDKKRPLKTFELKAGPRPVLKPATDPAHAAEPANAGGESDAADAAPTGRQAQKELILRVVEAVKGL